MVAWAGLIPRSRRQHGNHGTVAFVYLIRRTAAYLEPHRISPTSAPEKYCYQNPETTCIRIFYTIWVIRFYPFNPSKNIDFSLEIGLKTPTAPLT